MLSGRTFEPFEIHSCPGLVREFDRPHLQCFQRLQHLVTPWTLDTDEIAGLCNGSDRKIEGFSAAGCDDDLVGRACGSLPKHEPRHLRSRIFPSGCSYVTAVSSNAESASRIDRLSRARGRRRWPTTAGPSCTAAGSMLLNDVPTTATGLLAWVATSGSAQLTGVRVT